MQKSYKIQSVFSACLFVFMYMYLNIIKYKILFLIMKIKKKKNYVKISKFKYILLYFFTNSKFYQRQKLNKTLKQFYKDRFLGPFFASLLLYDCACAYF